MTRNNRSSNRSARLLTGSALAAVLICAAALAQDPSFVRFSQYEVEVDGTPDAQAVLYRSVSPPAFLLRVPRISSNYFRLDPSGQKVEWIGHQSVSPGQDGHLALTAEAEARQVGSYQVAGSAVSLEIDGHALRLIPRKPLLDLKQAADLLSYDELYGQRSQAYRPDPLAVRGLRKVREGATVTVYFGSWCNHCQEKVPYILRLQDELADTPVRFQYFGLPRGFGNHPKAQELNLRWVPTAVVTRGGEEIGRVEGHDWDDPPERKLAAILK